MTEQSKLIELIVRGQKRAPTCKDFDEGCEDIPDKVHCYLYDPAQGMCPFLRALAGEK